jgi:hypothetical protein
MLHILRLLIRETEKRMTYARTATLGLMNDRVTLRLMFFALLRGVLFVPLLVSRTPLLFSESHLFGFVLSTSYLNWKVWVRTARRIGAVNLIAPITGSIPIVVRCKHGCPTERTVP